MQLRIKEIDHLKLGLQLQELGYKFKGKHRLGIYLTNNLDKALKKSAMLRQIKMCLIFSKVWLLLLWLNILNGNEKVSNYDYTY